MRQSYLVRIHSLSASASIELPHSNILSLPQCLEVNVACLYYGESSDHCSATGDDLSLEPFGMHDIWQADRDDMLLIALGDPIPVMSSG